MTEQLPPSEQTIITFPVSTQTQAGNVQSLTEKKEGLDYKVGQLEVKLAGLEKEIENRDNQRKWIVGSFLVVIGLGIAGGTFVFNIFNESQKNLFMVQQRYYNELLDSRRNDTEFRNEIRSEIEKLDNLIRNSKK